MTDLLARRSNPSSNELLKHQGNLVTEGFRNLISKYGTDEEQSNYSHCLGDSSVEHIAFHKELSDRLHSNLLPLLRRLIIKLSQELDPINLAGKPLFTLDIILRVQFQLEYTLKQFPGALQILCMVIFPFHSGRTNDQYIGNCKYFRGDGLFALYTEGVIGEITKLFEKSCELIEQMGLSYEINRGQPHIDTIRESIIEHTSSACKEIDSTIGWLEGSELDLVQWGWPTVINGIDDQLKELSSFINRTPLDEGDSELMNEPLNEHNEKIAKTIPPIVKLSRLLLKKLSTRGMNQKRLQSCTGMRSDQLRSLRNLAANVSNNLDEFIADLKAADRSGRDVAGLVIMKTAGALIDHFTSSWFLISTYFVPLIPDNKDFSVQNYYRTWFVTWFDHFRLAINQLEEASKTIRWR
ncbi:hypothetical protein MJO28_008453 [Puccinia striiformis f. sp. tritici]|uniref:Uncharacterized protein n=4 Tax=Puccinia striiformis TaxID=27350 RepID=A0A0L0UX84_9BASI|nr:hypothetical protein Pst134EB_016593 [Puccinia striiformis f. sp. tritici]KAI9602781.1 hypothetical protein H4Q26_002081 [Puccinia striiformis f. sp. tritici PST-130]KNE91354.1 hypothetical protein PSTG_15218 [Puccinia striiformis f. sp. tritici PST-78]POW07382.1 hypothetical protein PSTT_08325 [Puccinia striiformis]KAI7949632.1 hypothetical protein MJO28_008453 [Puccinia striiformis f. sp. tritici]